MSHSVAAARPGVIEHVHETLTEDHLAVTEPIGKAIGTGLLISSTAIIPTDRPSDEGWVRPIGGLLRVVSELTVYVGLFMVVLAAATILPMQSEVALAGLLVAGYSPGFSPWSRASVIYSAPS